MLTRLIPVATLIVKYGSTVISENMICCWDISPGKLTPFLYVWIKYFRIFRGHSEQRYFPFPTLPSPQTQSNSQETRNQTMDPLSVAMEAEVVAIASNMLVIPVYCLFLRLMSRKQKLKFSFLCISIVTWKLPKKFISTLILSQNWILEFVEAKTALAKPFQDITLLAPYQRTWPMNVETHSPQLKVETHSPNELSQASVLPRSSS